MSAKELNTYVYESLTSDPYKNIAVERYLTSNVKDNEIILYLWQNADTVVIGKNQNIYKEVDTELMKKNGVHICRRFSGGGAVYHDMGNLNFSFIATVPVYSVKIQTDVVVSALRKLGIDAVAGGRNDIYQNGQKLSGNAYYTVCGASCHHGTLMLDVDLKKLSVYLAKSPKFASRAVESVVSPVANISDLCGTVISADRMKTLLSEAFSSEYGKARKYSVPREANVEINALADYIASESWIYSRRIRFSCVSERKFSYGNVEFCINVSGNVVTGARVYTDSLCTDDYIWVESALLGRKFTEEELEKAIRSSVKDAGKADDLVAMSHDDFFSRQT